jgi:hypothetical protein
VNAIVRVEPFVAMLLVVLCLPVAAAEPRPVAWHTNVETAWSTACEQGRPLLLFVTREDCAFCTQMKDDTYSHPGIANLVNQSFVPLVLDGRAGLPLLKELNVNLYPCTFVISPQAVVLMRVEGYLSPRDFGRRLATARPPAGAAHMAQGP